MLSPKKAKGLGYRHAHFWRNLSLCTVVTVFWSDSHVQTTGRHGHFQAEQLVLEWAKLACIRSCKKSQNDLAILKDKFLQSILAFYFEGIWGSVYTHSKRQQSTHLQLPEGDSITVSRGVTLGRACASFLLCEQRLLSELEAEVSVMVPWSILFGFPFGQHWHVLQRYWVWRSHYWPDILLLYFLKDDVPSQFVLS